MTAMHMEILVDKKQVDRMVLALEETLTGPSMMLFHEMAVQPILRQRAKERFASEGDSATGRWAPLKESTEDIREHAGFPPSHPINHRTGELEDWITNGKNQFTVGGEWAAFFMPGRATPRKKAKLTTAQQGKRAGFPMPGGMFGGTKPSPSATPPRPVIGMDAADLAHIMAALPIWIGEQVARRSGDLG